METYRAIFAAMCCDEDLEDASKMAGLRKQLVDAFGEDSKYVENADRMRAKLRSEEPFDRASTQTLLRVKLDPPGRAAIREACARLMQTQTCPEGLSPAKRKLRAILAREVSGEVPRHHALGLTAAELALDDIEAEFHRKGAALRATRRQLLEDSGNDSDDAWILPHLERLLPRPQDEACRCEYIGDARMLHAALYNSLKSEMHRLRHDHLVLRMYLSRDEANYVRAILNVA